MPVIPKETAFAARRRIVSFNVEKIDDYMCESWEVKEWIWVPQRRSVYLGFVTCSLESTTFLRYTHIIFCGHLRLGWIPTWRYEDRVLTALRALFGSIFRIDIFYRPSGLVLPVLGLSSLPPASKIWINSAIHWFCLYLHSVATTLAVVLLNLLSSLHPAFGTEFVEHFFGHRTANRYSPIYHTQVSSSYNTSLMHHCPATDPRVWLSRGQARTWICYWLYIQQW